MGGISIFTLDYIIKRFNCDVSKSPVKINISRFKSFITLLKELGYKTGAEIGVAKGGFSLALVQGIPDLKLYCVDSWKPYGDYVEHHNEDDTRLGECYQIAKQRLSKYNCELIRKPSMDAVKFFKDESLDFVFIDGNHSFRYVIDDIDSWSRKVRKGGMIAGHDFWESSERPFEYIKNMLGDEQIRLCQVKIAVKAWTLSNKINPWFVITGDKCRSWFWIK